MYKNEPKHNKSKNSLNILNSKTENNYYTFYVLILVLIYSTAKVHNFLATLSSSYFNLRLPPILSVIFFIALLF